jgi:hypothetical protein
MILSATKASDQSPTSNEFETDTQIFNVTHCKIDIGLLSSNYCCSLCKYLRENKRCCHTDGGYACAALRRSQQSTISYAYLRSVHDAQRLH